MVVLCCTLAKAARRVEVELFNCDNNPCARGERFGFQPTIVLVFS